MLASGALARNISSSSGVGPIAISIGGKDAYVSGTDLSQTCSTFNALAARYQAIIDTYQPERLDFDLEGPLVANQTSVVSEWGY